MARTYARWPLRASGVLGPLARTGPQSKKSRRASGPAVNVEAWGFYWRLTDTLRYHPTSCSRASGLLASISQHVYQVIEKWSLLGDVRCFWRVLENYDCRTKFNSSLDMEYNGELYGFSAVKVKLVDSLI